MPASFRKERADIFAHSATDTDGIPGSVLSRVHSESGTDGKWWASKSPARAGERQIAAQMGHEIDTTWGFGMEAVDALTPDGRIRHEDEWHSIDSILENDRLQEILVNTRRSDDEPTPGSVYGDVSDLATLVLTPSNATIPVLGTQQFTVQGYDSTGMLVDLTHLPDGWTLSWTKGGAGQAAIDVSPTGLVTGVSPTTDDAFVVVEVGEVGLVTGFALITVTP